MMPGRGYDAKAMMPGRGYDAKATMQIKGATMLRSDK